MKFRLLVISCWLIASAAFAILDTNSNGVSDLWEREHNARELFGGTFDPQADPDSDGWTNAQEAAAGTSPFEANPPDGMIRPSIVHIPAVISIENGVSSIITPAAITVSWPTLTGKQYTLFCSPDLAAGSWISVGEPFIATGGEVTYGFEISPAEKCFWRVAVNDADSDNDNLTNYEETLSYTNPQVADSDYDGIGDQDELANGFDPLDYRDGSYDDDNDGIENQYEFVLGFDPRNANTNGTLDTERDRDGDGMTDVQEAQTGYFRWNYQTERYLFQRRFDWELDDRVEDYDADELSNIAELQHSTDPFDPDSDDDFMPDGWEIRYHGATVIGLWSVPPVSASFVQLDPNNPTDASLDPDGDLLSNLQEYQARSQPSHYDSDSDGVSDGDESQAGSDPSNGADGGTPGGAGSGTVVVDMTFAVGGDYAWWEMEIKGQGPTDTRSIVISSNKDAEAGYGYYEGNPQSIKLHAGNKYRVAMKRMGGVEDWYCWSAHCGKDPVTEDLLPSAHTFTNYPGSAADRLAGADMVFVASGENSRGEKASWLVDNQQGLFTQHIDDYGNDVARSLEAFLVPVEVKDNIVATGVDDVSKSANTSDPGYQEDFWIMAPLQGTGSFAYENLSQIKIPMGSSDEGELTCANATPDSDPAAANTSQVIDLNGTFQDVLWTGLGNGINSEQAVKIKINGDATEHELPVKVKAMKYRNVKLRVYLSAMKRDEADPIMPDPNLVPTETELENYLNPLFAYQMNTWFDVSIAPNTKVVDWGEDFTYSGSLINHSDDQNAVILKHGGLSGDYDMHLFLLGHNGFLKWHYGDTLTKGVTAPDSNTCWALARTAGSLNTKQEVLEIVGHEIGHIFFGAGHPDALDANDRGEAPLVGTDHAKRLMYSLNDADSRLIVKKEWDKAEEWLKTRPRGDN